MHATDSIKLGVTYIEQTLKTTVTAEELAGMAGYSVWHYCRLFAKIMGMPVAAYISKRRLDGALLEISAGRKAADVVPEYGFDTYAGFYKAFVRVYGCFPKKYLTLYGGHQSKRLGENFMVMEHELRDALANWDIPQDLQLRDIYILDGAKVSGHVWAVGDGYILKTGERGRLMNNIRIGEALSAQGFASAAAIATKSGEVYLDGERVFTLSHKVPGGPLPKDCRWGSERHDYGHKLGQGIAKLHRALASVEAAIMPDETNLYEQVCGRSMPNVQKQNEQWGMGLTDGFFKEYAEVFGAVFSKLPKQLIHRDPHPSNILFHRGEVSGFIGFDLGERSIRLWDPCYCATGILSEASEIAEPYDKWIDILGAILKGYDSVNSLTEGEKQAIFYVICSIQMICIAYFESIDEYKELAKTNREMLMAIAKNKVRIMGLAEAL